MAKFQKKYKTFETKEVLPEAVQLDLFNKPTRGERVVAAYLASRNAPKAPKKKADAHSAADKAKKRAPAADDLGRRVGETPKAYQSRVRRTTAAQGRAELKKQTNRAKKSRAFFDKKKSHSAAKAQAAQEARSAAAAAAAADVPLPTGDDLMALL